MASTSDDELEYLTPGFDPSILKVPRLRSILVAHDIQYPSSAKKSQLIDIFNDQLVPRSRKILAARSRTKRTSKGITDMPSSQEGTVNGDDDGARAMPPPPVPETSRRMSRKEALASLEESAEDITTTRKSVGGRKSSTKHPRNSDSEDLSAADGTRPVVRKSRRSEAIPRVKIEEPAEASARPPLGESAFSDDNPFQRGSSPLGPGEFRRKSAGASGEPRKGSTQRRRTVEPGHTGLALVEQEGDVRVPSSKTFEVPLTRLKSKGAEEKAINTDEPGEEFTPEEQLELVLERAANGEVDILPPRRKKRAEPSRGVTKSAFWVIATTLLTGYAAWWRREKIDIGYCGIGKPATALSTPDMPEWVSVFEPQCEPCPQHAYCYSPMEARCEPNYVLKNHPLSLGGLVPIAPTCEPDGEKVRKIKTVADKAVEELRERRAQWECGTLTDEEGREEKAVEIEEQRLKAHVSQKRRKGMADAEFEDLWKGALGEVLGREEVSGERDGNTKVYRLSSNSLARISFGCSIRRTVRRALARYRVETASLVVLLSAFLYIRSWFIARQQAIARVPGLVAIALDRLATQAAMHERSGTTEPYISVNQMRDYILRDEFSAAKREEIWKRVRPVVEANANIRSSVKEGRAGEVSRLWEWIGMLPDLEDGARSGGREIGRLSLGPIQSPGRNESPVVVPASTGMVEGLGHRHWDEGRPIY